MNRRAFLTVLVAGLALVGITLAAYPFAVALWPSDRAMNDSVVLIDLPPLEPGVVHTVTVENAKLFFLKPTRDQFSAIEALDPYVSNTKRIGFQEEIGAFVYWAYSTRWHWHCSLEHFPPAGHSEEAASFNPNWLGGYWDPLCEVSYDYAGRAIEESTYSFNGFPWSGEGLKAPAVFSRNGGKYAVSKFAR